MHPSSCAAAENLDAPFEMALSEAIAFSRVLDIVVSDQLRVSESEQIHLYPTDCFKSVPSRKDVISHPLQ